LFFNVALAFMLATLSWCSWVPHLYALQGCGFSLAVALASVGITFRRGRVFVAQASAVSLVPTVYGPPSDAVRQPTSLPVLLLRTGRGTIHCALGFPTTAANSHISPQTSSSLVPENSRSISGPLHRLPPQQRSPRHTRGAAPSSPTKDPLSLLASMPAD
jgi:hypothetical protein